MCGFCIDPHQLAVSISCSKRIAIFLVIMVKWHKCIRKDVVDETFANSLPAQVCRVRNLLLSIIKYKLESFSARSRVDNFCFRNLSSFKKVLSRFEVYLPFELP